MSACAGVQALARECKHVCAGVRVLAREYEHLRGSRALARECERVCAEVQLRTHRMLLRTCTGTCESELKRMQPILWHCQTSAQRAAQCWTAYVGENWAVAE